jgi:signal transduction histidine kinase
VNGPRGRDIRENHAGAVASAADPTAGMAGAAARTDNASVRTPSRQFQWFILVLLLAAVTGLFIAAEFGKRQLAAATGTVERVAQRTHALGSVQQLLSAAESGQRGYILLGDSAYLAPYREGLERLDADLARLTAAFADEDPRVRGDVAELVRLSHVKFDEMSESVDLYHERGRSAAIALIRTDFGQHTARQITDLVRDIQAAETDEMLQASRSWRTDRWSSTAITLGALLLSLSLVWLLRRLVLRHMHSKDREAEEAAEREAQLERVVKRRTEDLSELSTQLQSVAEKERAALSRELHDELGGLLVAARMDVSWLEERVASTDPEVRAQFKRVQDALQDGVELKRRVVENLRPTLLDNLGLFSALRWQVSDSCGRVGLHCIEHYPDQELDLSPEAAIAIFRIVQESLTNILKHAQAKNVEVSVETHEDWLVLAVRDDGIGLPVDRRRVLRSHGLASMRHRAIGFGGQWRIIRRAERGTEVEVRLPLGRIRRAADKPEAQGLSATA